MPRPLITLLTSTTILLTTGAWTLTQPPTTSTTQPATTPTPATISAAAFLAGDWTGSMSNSLVQECWTSPSGTNIIGMFRWMKPDGTPSMIELLSISEEEGTLRLRMRHHNAALVGWEEKDKPVVMNLASSSTNKLTFAAANPAGDLASVTYTREADKLAIDVEFTAGEKPRKPLNFRMEKAAK